MASLTTAQATTTTLHHNVGNPEDDVSQMLLLFIVGIAAAMFAVCVARTTKCCMRECRGKPKKKTEFQQQIEASQNNTESSGHSLHYAVFSAAANWMELVNEKKKTKPPSLETSKSGPDALENDDQKQRDGNLKSATTKALITSSQYQEHVDSTELEETRSNSPVKSKQLEHLGSIPEITDNTEDPLEHKPSNSVKNNPQSTDASSKEDKLFVKATPRKPAVKFDDSVAYCEDLA